jgi:hypothetical protein
MAKGKTNLVIKKLKFNLCTLEVKYGFFLRWLVENVALLFSFRGFLIIAQQLRGFAFIDETD